MNSLLVYGSIATAHISQVEIEEKTVSQYPYNLLNEHARVIVQERKPKNEMLIFGKI